MNVLLMGNLELISTMFLSKLEEDYKCIIYDEREDSDLKGKGVINYLKEGTGDEELLKVFAAFDFETVIFFSSALDGAVKVYDELEKVESVICASRKYKVKHFIYITSNDLYMEGRSRFEGKSREILLHACEDLCTTFADEERMNFLVLKIPYLYNLKNQTNQLARWIEEANKGKELEIRGTEYHETDFLCDEDLGELVARILDEPIKERYVEMFLSGENHITVGRLAELLKKNIPGVNITYQNRGDCLPCFKKDAKARTEYGWYPKHILEYDIESMVAENAQKREKRLKKKTRRRRYRKLQDRIRIVLELMVLVAAAEVLNYFTRDNVLMNFIDFRLIAVIILGTMNGLNTGVVAAVLSSIGYVISNAASTHWQIIFYNVENWLPFACYFLLGAISGYTRDKHDDDIIYAKEEHELLEKKYVFLCELYNRVLESKDSFNSQIIGYKDSFGKVYSVVKKLDTVLPDQVFFEAVNILEELLENSSVAIYTVNKMSDFARLNVCSKPMNSALNKSLKMSDYPEMMVHLREHKGFVNTACLENYPAYAAPIHKDGELMGMILLMNSTNRQMNMEFSNKFSIISDLICDALVRAMEFEQVSKHYIEGTQILVKEKFKEILVIKEQMRGKQYLDYIMLRVHKAGMSPKELSDRVCRLVRNNDVLGMGEDGHVYLILSQTKSEDLAIIEERMHKNGITFKVMKG